MKKQTLIEQSLETLKNNGFKYTKKREALLTYLVKRNRYVSAKEVFDYMNQEFKGNERNPYVSNELFRRTARWMYDRRA